MIGEFSKVAEQKISTQKSIVFLYTGNEQKETEIETTIYNSIIHMKCLRVNLRKGLQGVYAENYKPLLRDA